MHKVKKAGQRFVPGVPLAAGRECVGLGRYPEAL